jgi:branched-chain amino acid transport system permease protein
MRRPRVKLLRGRLPRVTEVLRNPRIAVLAFAGAILALAACGRTVDDDMATMCRMTLPALNAEGAEIHVARVTPGSGPREVRIDYSVVVERGALRRRFVVCGFAAIPRSQIEPDLETLVTETGPVSGASVHLMKRFWLRTPEAFEADPGNRG